MQEVYGENNKQPVHQATIVTFYKNYVSNPWEEVSCGFLPDSVAKPSHGDNVVQQCQHKSVMSCIKRFLCRQVCHMKSGSYFTDHRAVLTRMNSLKY